MYFNIDLFNYVFIFIFGCLIGSFLNVVILRLPKILEKEWTKQSISFLKEHAILSGDYVKHIPKHADYNLLTPASQCPNCKNAIKYFDNIPILSYILLRGKCRNCSVKISPQYPLVELLSGLLFILCIFYFDLTVKALLAILFSSLLLTLTFIDFNEQILPDIITIPGVWIGLLVNNLNIFTSIENAVTGAALGYLLLWCIYQGFLLITGKEGMGYGDFKLLAMLGAWLGWQQLPLIILFSSVMGSIYGIAQITKGSHKDKPFAYGPFLCLAGLVTFFVGDEILTWYLSYV